MKVGDIVVPSGLTKTCNDPLYCWNSRKPIRMVFQEAEIISIYDKECKIKITKGAGRVGSSLYLKKIAVKLKSETVEDYSIF